jgi:GTP pyrophosphokinase
MDIALIFKAATFAADAHCHQKRNYHQMPYINHLIRVTEQAALAKLSSEAIAAAFLHDVLEDTEVKYEELQRYFPERVVKLVKLLTKWWPDYTSGKEIETFKAQYFECILEDNEAIDLKLLDRSDNVLDFVTSLPDSSEESKDYLFETKKDFPILFERSKNEIVKSRYLHAVRTLESALRV